MKQFTIIVFLLMTTVAFGQFATEWEYSQSAGNLPPWFETNDSRRGLAYGVFDGNDRVYVANHGVSGVVILDAATGDSVGILNQSGTRVEDIEVTEDGVIIGCNLIAPPWVPGDFKIYKWSSETGVREEEIVYSNPNEYRLGDKITVVGDYAAGTAEIYAAVGNSNKILKWTMTDAAFDSTPVEITVDNIGSFGTMPSVAPLGMGDANFFVNGNSINPFECAATGDTIGHVSGDLVGNGSSAIRSFNANSNVYIVTYQWFNKENAHLLDVTDGAANAISLGETPILGDNTNGNGTGDVDFKDNGDGTYTIFVLACNNGVGAYMMELPEIEVTTIAEAKVDANNDFQPDRLGEVVTIKGIVTSTNFRPGLTQYYLQDMTAGIAMYPPSSANISLDLNFGDEILITGEVDQYRGLSLIDPASAEDVTVLSTGNTVEPKKITVAEVNEENEALLVQIDSVWIVDMGQWPGEGSSGSVDITDGKDTTYIFIDRDTDLDGWMPPSGMMNLIALVDQYSSASDVYDDGYSLRGTFRENFIDISPPVIPNIVINEINYNPIESGRDTTEFVELFNAEEDTVELSGFMFNEGFNFTFPEGSIINPGEYIVIAVDSAAFRNYYGFDAHYEWDSGALSNGGEDIRLVNADTIVVDYVDYNDAAPWPTECDGNGPSLELIDPALDNSLGENWQDSYVDGGTPGAENSEKYVPEAESLFPLWSQTQAADNYPAYMSTSNYERGMAYGKVNGMDRVYIVTRWGDHRVVIHDAISGDSVGVIPKPPQAEGVGYFHLNCVDVSDDGVIFVCNMSLGSDVAHPFRVYSWTSETADAATAVSYDAALGRMGDMFSVYGSVSDNSVTIYAGVANSNLFVKFTTADNGATFTPEVITLEDGSFGTLSNIADAGDGTLYIKSYGKPLVHINADGTVIDTVSTEVVGSGASKIKFMSDGEKKHLLVYYPDVGGSGDLEKLHVIDLTNGDENAYVAYYSSSIGSLANGNGTGSVDIMPLGNEKFVYYLFGTNNGLAAFTNDENFVLANLDTLFYGDTPIIHDNPYGDGYIAGTNSYGDLGKYQRFDFNDQDALVGFRVYFGVKNIVGESDSLDMVVRTVDQNGAPGDLLGSARTTTDALDTTLVGSTFFLDNPITVTGPVFIGFEWDASVDDEFAIFADADSEGEGANRVWEKFEDGSYNDFGSTLNPGFSWLVDVDLWIAAYYKKATPTSVKNDNENGMVKQFTLRQNYPNPFNPTTSISFALPGAAQIEITVYNVMGQKVDEIFKGKLSAGSHTFHFKADHLSSGVYFYKLKADDFTAVRKMLLVK